MQMTKDVFEQMTKQMTYSAATVFMRQMAVQEICKNPTLTTLV
jgi:hypothetical protein